MHTMLVVPKLSSPVHFENNHLESCNAVVSHKESIIHFRDPSMQFKIKCPTEEQRHPIGTVEMNFVYSEKPQKFQHGIILMILSLTCIFINL